jgi:hypothetical protein
VPPGAGALAVQRRRELATMTDSAAIQRREATGDERGGRTLGAWETVSGLESVPCRYWPRGDAAPHEVEGTTRVQVISLWGFAVPVGTDVRSTDRLEVGSRHFEVVQSGAHTDASELVLTALEVL